MEQSEIKNLSEVELKEEITKAKADLTDLGMAHAVSPLEDTSQFKSTRRTLARLKTELGKREEN